MIGISSAFNLGPHFNLYFEACNPDKLEDEKNLTEFFKKFSEKFNFNQDGAPVIFNCMHKASEDNGLCAIALFKNANIIVYLFPKLKQVFIGMFSLQEFDFEQFVGLAKEFFLPESYNVNFFSENSDFPTKIQNQAFPLDFSSQMNLPF